MNGRIYEKQRDRKAFHRIWRECGWLSEDKNEIASADLFAENCATRVWDINNEAESIVMTLPGDYRYGQQKLDLTAVTGVTTGRIARRQGIAGKLLAESLAIEAEKGAVLAGLGIFEQGFYDRLGFGTTAYEHWLSFDPTHLNIPQLTAIPERLELKDWKALHANRLKRRRLHGSVNIFSPTISKCNMLATKNGFGLGFRSGQEVTHHIWFGAHEDVESGPYSVWWMAYHNPKELEELLAVIKSLGDQVLIVTIREPIDIQLQDFLEKPFRYRNISKGSKHGWHNNAEAYHQLRICDIRKAIAAVQIEGEKSELNLTLSDPIDSFLPKGGKWRGCAGEYTVSLGLNSLCKFGHTKGLPHLKTDIGSFTRLWTGALSASALQVGRRIEADTPMVESLNRIFNLPKPSPDWDY